jgi:alcohol dehydrogenase (cytochrome c)
MNTKHFLPNVTFLTVTLAMLAGCDPAATNNSVSPDVSAGQDAAATQESTVAAIEWPYYGGTQWGERHAKLSSINKDTVAQLVPRRVLQLGQVPYSLTASPLVIDGVLYISTSDGVVQAFELRSGMRKWSFQHRIKSMTTDANAAAIYGVAGPPCCSNTSRGVAYADGTVFLATLDAKLVAIDADTGKKKWEVWGAEPADNPGNTYGYNSAPVAVGNMVVVGTTGGESPTRNRMTAGDPATPSRG